MFLSFAALAIKVGSSALSFIVYKIEMNLYHFSFFLNLTVIELYVCTVDIWQIAPSKFLWRKPAKEKKNLMS